MAGQSHRELYVSVCQLPRRVVRPETPKGETVYLALKVVDRSRVSRKQLARFHNEVRFCSQPHSRHIIHVLDSGKGDGEELFYVMPYFPGTLRSKMRAGVKADDVLLLYTQVLDAVEAAHFLGAVTSHIKP